MAKVRVQRFAGSRWLAVLLPYSVIAGGGRGGGEEEWRPQGYESAYVEAAVTVICLMLALAFEKVWHHFQNHIRKAHHPQTSAPEELFEDVMNRAGVEFMTLGFLACCIFAFNKCGGFKWCVNTIHDEGMNLPITAEEWLHVAEDVHMQLFVGMIIYFAVISRIVRGAVAQLRHWEDLQALCRGTEPGPERTGLPADFQEYSRWLFYFNSHMICRSQHDLAEFTGLFADLDIDSSEVDYTEKLQRFLAEDFSLHRYLAANVSAGICDSIQIHCKTWLVMTVSFVLFGLLHRYAHWTMDDLIPGVVVAAIMVLLVMQAVVRREQVDLRSRARVAAKCKTEFGRSSNASLTKAARRKRRLHEKYNTEILVVRVLQVTLFLISYILARDLIDFFDGWDSNSIRKVCLTVLLSAMILLLARWVPRSMPLFLALMSMPPYVDKDNFRLFSDVLLVCTQESQAKLKRGSTREQPTPFQDSSRMVVKDRSLSDDWGSGVGTTIPESGNLFISTGAHTTISITSNDTLPSEDKDNENDDLVCNLAACRAEDLRCASRTVSLGEQSTSDILRVRLCTMPLQDVTTSVSPTL